ncbi:exodeoxyribonuclease VII [Pyrenophora seminiperda CCB06]|uniref:Exodeoxyribonuclease VII n=1 Tax=Pyrenophora seminiperda CCB06 TaxID=1302712 RepID=A0A3M7MHW1_9PLEO|nr:exodeoxyribonuclease VII [Pyrenophora seminiperda CCB06]
MAGYHDPSHYCTMSNEQDGASAASPSANDLAQLRKAFQELQRGEQTAAALENHLDSIEKKIEALLGQAQKAEEELQKMPVETGQSSTSDEKGSS